MRNGRCDDGRRSGGRRYSHSGFPTGFDDVVSSVLSRFSIHFERVLNLRHPFGKGSAGDLGVGEDGGDEKGVLSRRTKRTPCQASRTPERGRKRREVNNTDEPQQLDQLLSPGGEWYRGLRLR